jgi:hypothetical protein
MIERSGASFEDISVVENYIYRPPYPDGIYDKLLSIAQIYSLERLPYPDSFL